MRRAWSWLGVVTVLTSTAVGAHAETPGFGWGIRYTASPDAHSNASLAPLPTLGGVHARVRVYPGASLEVSVELMRAWAAEELDDAVFASAARRRRYMYNLDVAHRQHLVSQRRHDAYALAGVGLSHEQINGEDEGGDVMYNATSARRVRLFVGFGGELRTPVGERSSIGLGIEVRGSYLPLPGPDEQTGPPPLAAFGAQLTVAVTHYY